MEVNHYGTYLVYVHDALLLQDHAAELVAEADKEAEMYDKMVRIYAVVTNGT